ncbi:hypothetical protein [uncultured Ruegeria sp.]|uniref:hypothetical protein n=1 Tax=uncultured Ruegeria sp. TaxID=259304 RepID=UPI0026255BF0|nr:hypothetical protein [uncultured Ruegeria sp.]
MRLWIVFWAFALVAGTARATPHKYTLQSDKSQVDFGWFLGPDEIIQALMLR